MADSLIGQELGGVQITRLLKRTNMSEIYLAWNPRLQRDDIVKIMRPAHEDESFALRFQQEAVVTARLSHPNIVRIWDFGQRADLSYMVMEYLPGGSLYDRLLAAAGEGKRLDPAYAAEVVRQMALALHAAHQAGIIHRDVKPSNILFARDGRPVLTDLGISKAREGPRVTKTLTAVGTPEYMSPEQGRGDDVDARTDVYSLGVVLYELLAGVLPFQSETAWGLVFKHMYEPPPPLQQYNPAISPAMRSVVEKAMAKQPHERFQSGQEMADAIDRAVKAPTRRLYPPPAAVTPPGQTPAAGTPRGTPPGTPRAQTPAPQPSVRADDRTRLIQRTTGGVATATPGAESGALPARQPTAPSPRRQVLWIAGGVGTVLALVAVALLVSAGLGSMKPSPKPGSETAIRAVTAAPAGATVSSTSTLQAVLPALSTPKSTSAAVPTAAPSAVPAKTASPKPTVTPVPTASWTRTVAPTPAHTPSSTPTFAATSTRLPTQTPATPGLTPAPTRATAVGTAANTPVPTRPPTAAPAPTKTPASPSGVPALVSPAENTTVSGEVTFSWAWRGPALTPEQGFEVRLWKEGQPEHWGAAEPTSDTSITINLDGAYGVSLGGAGAYYWTVAVVQRNPYQRTGQEAPHRRLYLAGGGGGGGGVATSTPPPP